MTIMEKLKERKLLGIVVLGFYGLGFFVGISVGRLLSLTSYIVLSTLSLGIYFWASTGPLEKIKAKLFPSHPDYKQSRERNL
jgi:hypothetical protein